MSQEVIYTSESTAARRRVYFQLVDSTDGITGKTGQTGVGRISKNGGTTAATSGSLVQIDSTNMPGRYYIELTTGEVDTIGTVVLRYKGATTAEMVAQAAIVSYDPYAAPSTSAQIAGAIWDEARASHTTAGSFGQGVASVQGNVTGSAASVTADVGITQAGADKVWASTTRTLSAFSTALALSVWHVLDASIVTAATVGLRLKGLTFTTSNKVDAAFNAAGDLPQAAADKVWATSARALTDKSNFALSASGMDAPLDSANGVETGLSLRGAWRLLSSALFGKASGLDTSTAVFRNAVADSKVRITSTTTIDGNRTVVTTDQT